MKEHHSLVSDLLKGLPLSFLKLLDNFRMVIQQQHYYGLLNEVKPLRNAQQ